MAGPRGRCQATSRNTTSFTVFIKINFAYQVKVTERTSIIRCGEDKSPPPRISQYAEFAGSFSANITMNLNDAGTAFEPVAADIANYDTNYDAKFQQLTNAVAAENMVIKTIESKTANVECVPGQRCPPRDPVMGTATRTVTKRTEKTLFVSGSSVSTSGGAYCSF